MTMDAIELLSGDHRELEQQFRRFRSILAKGRTQLAARRKLVRDLVRLIGDHSELEAIAVYPLIRETNHSGAVAVDRSLEQNERITAVLRELEEEQPASHDFDARMVVLFEKLRDHIADEERDLFPRLSRHLGEQGLRELGQRLTEIRGKNGRRAAG
jgi:hemerythrin-like domain-containing protein